MLNSPDVCHFRWLPESSRWLLANGKADTAHFYIMKCARMNNRSTCMDAISPKVDTCIQFSYRTTLLLLPWTTDNLTLKNLSADVLCMCLCVCVVCFCPAHSQTLLDSLETKDKKYTFLDLVRTPNIRKLAIISGIVW